IPSQPLNGLPGAARAVFCQSFGHRVVAGGGALLRAGNRPLGQLLDAVVVGGIELVGQQEAGAGGALGGLGLAGAAAEPLDHFPASAAVALNVAGPRPVHRDEVPTLSVIGLQVDRPLALRGSGLPPADGPIYRRKDSETGGTRLEPDVRSTYGGGLLA